MKRMTMLRKVSLLASGALARDSVVWVTVYLGKASVTVQMGFSSKSSE